MSAQALQPAFEPSVGTPIEIIAGVYGDPRARRGLDIVGRLQQLCGTGANSCQVFCSDTSFGRYRLGHRPVCRVTYRCGATLVRSVEAAREEPILMRCPEPELPPTPAES